MSKLSHTSPHAAIPPLKGKPITTEKPKGNATARNKPAPPLEAAAEKKPLTAKELAAKRTAVGPAKAEHDAEDKKLRDAEKAAIKKQKDDERAEKKAVKEAEKAARIAARAQSPLRQIGVEVPVLSAEKVADGKVHGTAVKHLRDKDEAKVFAKESREEGLVRLLPNLTEYVKVRVSKDKVCMDSGDEVAVLLRNCMELEDVYKMAEDKGVPDVAGLRVKYANLNPGMQRMNLGNKIRTAMKPVDTAAIEAKAAAKLAKEEAKKAKEAEKTAKKEAREKAATEAKQKKETAALAKHDADAAKKAAKEGAEAKSVKTA